MPVRVNLAYQYDGSFEGFLSCVFESFEKQEIPSAIFAEEPEQLSLCPVRFIETDRSPKRFLPMRRRRSRFVF